MRYAAVVVWLIVIQVQDRCVNCSPVRRHRLLRCNHRPGGVVLSAAAAATNTAYLSLMTQTHKLK